MPLPKEADHWTTSEYEMRVSSVEILYCILYECLLTNTQFIYTRSLSCVDDDDISIATIFEPAIRKEFTYYVIDRCHHEKHPVTNGQKIAIDLIIHRCLRSWFSRA